MTNRNEAPAVLTFLVFISVVLPEVLSQSLAMTPVPSPAVVSSAAIPSVIFLLPGQTSSIASVPHPAVAVSSASQFILLPTLQPIQTSSVDPLPSPVSVHSRSSQTFSVLHVSEAISPTQSNRSSESLSVHASPKPVVNQSWIKYSSLTHWCTKAGGFFIGYGDITVVECQTRCLVIDPECKAIEFWEGLVPLCRGCNNTSKIVRFNDIEDLLYPVYVWIEALTWDNLYPYGTQQNDEEFEVNDTSSYWRCPEIRIDQFGLPFFAERHYKLFICSNGKIQLNYRWSWWWPQKFGVYEWFRRMAVIAPFWATTDEFEAFKAGHSKVYYQVYKNTNGNNARTSEILKTSSKHVQHYDKSGKFANFKATWVLVVTWVKICPFVYYPYDYYHNNTEILKLNCEWSNTFQAVIITDGLNSFLMYNYPKGGIQWVVPVIPSYYRYWTSAYGIPVAGWDAGDNGKNYLNMKGSGTLLGMYVLDNKPGNTGVLGRHFWRIENNDAEDGRQKCLKWTSLHESLDFLSEYNMKVRLDRRMACPCSGSGQAQLDRRFIWDWWNSWPKWCFRSRLSINLELYSRDKGILTFTLKQLCCYSTQWPGDWGALKTGPPDGGRLEVEVFNQRSLRVEEVLTDQEAYKHCCVDTPLCSLFYKYRPSDNCDLYVPPITRWPCCDPHFKTLDNRNYTFNGLGEYTMIDAKNGAFQLQVRTGLAQGNSTTATIFTAGAAKEENASTVEVKLKRGGGIIILLDGEIYSGYKDLTNRSVEIGKNLFASKHKENCLDVSFPSSTFVQFCEMKEMLSFVITPGDDYKNTTKGLLGTWNDNPDDDFTLPDGTVLPPSSTSREIHFGFGVKWQINQSQSFFTYSQSESVNTYARPDFMPMFADNITWYNDSVRLAAEAHCGDDQDCLFDVASTNDLSVGMVTKDIGIQSVNESRALENFPPKIVNTPSAINATLHQTVQLNITAEDNDEVTFLVINKPEGATVNVYGNLLYFTWPVTSSQKFNLSFVATDDKGASRTWNPTINMCACEHGGQCVQPEEGDSVNTDSKFVYMGCACQGGYTGRFCESNIDACEMNGQPCYAGVKCIDLPPPANVSGYTCGPCPTGYTGNGAQCAEIDECQSDQANNCEQICVNVPGSFFCDCREGYKLSVDGYSCEDVNECEPTSDCMQKCVNTLGSYNCSCDQYFETDPTDWKKCIVTNPCSSDHGCHHICYKGNDNQATCSCFANYELESDRKTCKDINECDPGKPLHLCNQICENTLGSYRCSCEKGFELNKNGYDCEDINECVDEDLYECTDEFHKCVNTRGSYKCECGQNLYFIDGKCRGLAKNETTPTPSLPPTRVPSVIEREQAVRISVDAGGKFNWDFKTDKSFKDKMASVTSTFCVENRTACALKDTRLQRRALPLALYTTEQVHLLPGYPGYLSSSLLVAFYVQQPLGLFIGNTSTLPESTLLAIVVRYKSELETAIGANITDVERLFYPTTLPPTPSVVPVEEHSFNKWKWIVIGVSAGVFFIILALVITFACVKNKGTSMVKPFSIDGPDEPIRMESMDSIRTANSKVSVLEVSRNA